jgi:glycerol kinase
VDELRANWIRDREWRPKMEASERDREYRLWKKAVSRTFDWVEAE